MKSSIFGKAQERAMLQVENEYVFNDIYFGDNGFTSASANHIAAMASVMATNIKESIGRLRLYDKYIRVIGDGECLVEEKINTLPIIAESAVKISKCNALVAWLREAIKEKGDGIDHVNKITFSEYCEQMGIELMPEPVKPSMPTVNFEDKKTILATGLTVKEYNRYLELNSTLAVYGELIHDRGLLTKQKRKLQDIASNPIEVNEGGRDTIITRYEADSMDELEQLYAELQREYRDLQAEKNGLEAKWTDLAAKYQVELKNQYDMALAEYKAQRDKFDTERAEVMSQMASWKKGECDRIGALKIILPNDLIDTFKELKEKYL